MKQKLIYVELKTGYNDDGPAWIGKGFYSRSGNTVYFNGLVLLIGRKGSCVEFGSGNSYWVSGIKKDGEDRHWAGHGKIMIDKSVVDEYLQIRRLEKLPKSKFSEIEFDNTPKVEETNKKRNEKLDK